MIGDYCGLSLTDFLEDFEEKVLLPACSNRYSTVAGLYNSEREIYKKIQVYQNFAPKFSRRFLIPKTQLKFDFHYNLKSWLLKKTSPKIYMGSEYLWEVILPRPSKMRISNSAIQPVGGLVELLKLGCTHRWCAFTIYITNLPYPLALFYAGF